MHCRFKNTDLSYYVCGAMVGFLPLTHFLIICMCFFVYFCVRCVFLLTCVGPWLIYQYLPIVDPIIYVAGIQP